MLAAPTLKQVAAALVPGGANAVFAKASQAPISQVSTDSRSLEPGALFVALRGPNHDGHSHVAMAQRHGAMAWVADAKGAAEYPQAQSDGLPTLVVADTLMALGELAHHHRQSIQRPTLAVTGSNGKTSTKELLAAALSCRGPTHRTAGNLNNLIGLPHTVFAWPSNAWAAVLEMGMNAQGEIARLTDIAQPDVGVITCVAPAHLEHLKTLSAIADAKAELVGHLTCHATAVINADDPILWQACQRALKDTPCVTFGRQHTADVRVVDVRHGAGDAHSKAVGIHVVLAVRDATSGTVTTFQQHLPVLGKHNAMNAAAALAAALALKLPQPIGAKEALSSMAKVTLPGSRLRFVRLKKPDVALLDDCYNANPGSMTAALETLDDLRPDNRRALAVVGDMLELGPSAPTLHHAIGEAAARQDIHVLAVGAMAQHVAHGAVTAGGRAQAFADVPALIDVLKTTLHDGDWLLVKGSHGMHLEEVIAALGQQAHQKASQGL